MREPEIWLRSQKDPIDIRRVLSEIFAPPRLRSTLVATFMNAATMFAWWGLFTWIPSFLKLPPEKGGAGLGVLD